eukprot:241343_1
MGNNNKGIAPGGGAARQYKQNGQNVKQHKFISEPKFSIASIDKNLKEIEKKFYGGKLWEFGIVPFEISQDIQQNCPELAQMILDAVVLCNKSLKNVYWISIIRWRNALCPPVSIVAIPSIKFVTADKGCNPSSAVGCYGVMEQKIRVCLYWPGTTKSCTRIKIKVGNILHEMTHAMGFHHEHARLDRDAYVDIDKEYKSNKNNFKKGVALGKYDFKSVMHYGHDACGVTVNNQYSENAKDIGQRDGYSELDKEGIDEIYDNERGKEFPDKMLKKKGDLIWAIHIRQNKKK